MTDHPCKAMTPWQIELFEQIATGNPLPPAPSGVFARLLAEGVIDHADPKILRDRLGEFSIPQYFVPLPVHAQWCQWCQWCSEQRENQEKQRALR